MDAKAIELMLAETKFITKPQQHLLIILRLHGKIDGKDGQNEYKSIRFFDSIKKLVEAGWVKKHYIDNSGTRPKTVYTMTNKGYEFNAMMMQYPEYREIWKMLPKKMAMPTVALGRKLT